MEWVQYWKSRDPERIRSRIECDDELFELLASLVGYRLLIKGNRAL